MSTVELGYCEEYIYPDGSVFIPDSTINQHKAEGCFKFINQQQAMTPDGRVWERDDLRQGFNLTMTNIDTPLALTLMEASTA